jgi:ComF family protein
VRTVAGAVLDVLLPPRCPGCRVTVARADSFCVACWAKLRFITAPLCACCGLPFEIDAGPDTRCGDCLAHLPRFASARAALVYDGPARDMLLALKHGDRDFLARAMAPAMARAGAAMLGADAVLVPVPLHRWRLWRRGYNQAALLAAAIARRTANPVAVDAIERVRNTPSSRGMSRSRRAANVRGVFRVARPAAVKGRDVVLVDDVLTTGATVGACARLLLRAGARRVDVLTWARVVRTGGPMA